MTTLAFDEPTHTYTLDGERVPSVTQVIKPLAMLDDVPEMVLEQARARGSRVHAAVDAYNRGAFDAELPPAERGYLDAWCGFLADSGAVVVASELRVAHPKLRYAGTLDTLLDVAGRTWLVDAKTTASVPPSVGPQTAGYAAAYGLVDKGLLLPVHRRACVLLRPDGKYRVHPLNDPADWAMFQSCLNIYKWRARQ